MTDKLKSCPFCGNTPEVEPGEYTGVSSHMGTLYSVQCSTEGDDECPCYPGTGDCRSEEEAIAQWNTRAETHINWQKGIPKQDGWYLVKLIPGHNQSDKPADVDYCRAESRSDGGQRGWIKWYKHNISAYAEIPGGINEN